MSDFGSLDWRLEPPAPRFWLLHERRDERLALL